VELSARVGAAEANVTALQGRVDATKAQIAALLTPTSVQAKVGDGKAEVRWAMAATTITASPGGANCTTNGLSGEQQCTVIGLTNGVDYTFTAQLTNMAGAGAISPPSNSVRPALVCHALLVATTGDGGQVTASPASSAGCTPGEYSPGELVTVTAIPDAGYGVTWSSPSGGAEDSAHLNYTITVPFAGAVPQVVASFAPCFPLTVSSAAGSGSTVVASPASNSSAGCAADSFVVGSRVVLKAMPASGWIFAGWNGALSAGRSATTLLFVMPAAPSTVGALFGQCYPLTFSSNGGEVTVSPSQDAKCPAGHFVGSSTLTLTAAAPIGYDFLDWSDTANSSANPLSFIMPAASASLLARIRSKPHSLTASFVLGQPSFTTAEDNNPVVAPYGLALPTGVAFNSAGNVYVADGDNHRVLVYAPEASTPFRVIGQIDFIGVDCNRGAIDAAANTLCSPTFVWVDQNDGLYVVDAGNHRVLYFLPGADTATRVYGQGNNFTSHASDGGAGGLYTPYGLALERDGSGLYIADALNHRVLYFPGTATLPTRVIGQPDFDAVAPGTNATGFGQPMGLALDSAGGLWVSATSQNRVLYFPAGSSVATRVLGQPDLMTTSTPMSPGTPGSASATRISYPMGVSVDLADGVYVADMFNSRVVYFVWGASVATRVWGQGGSFTSNLQNYASADPTFPTADSLIMPYALVFDSQNRMHVADTINSRVLRYELI